MTRVEIEVSPDTTQMHESGPLTRGARMARGKKCPSCGYNMFAEREQDQPMGSWVYYVCLNNSCKFREKVFEGK